MTIPYQKLIDTAAKQLHAPSVSLGVYASGTEQYFQTGHPRGPFSRAGRDTVYPIASVTKSFTVAALMNLAAAGKVDIDAPVTALLPEVALYTDELNKGLTLRDAMCHRSGLPRHDITLFTNPDASIAEMMAKLRYLEPAWPLRARFCYQNHLFGLPALAIERVTGQSWREAVQQQFLDPLGMTRTYTKYEAYLGVDRDHGAPRVRAAGLNLPYKTMNSDNVGSAGAMSSSARDLLQWVKLQMNGGQSDGGQQLIDADALIQMHTVQMPIRAREMNFYELPEVPEAGYGLGWFIENSRGIPIVHHGGTVFGFKSIAGWIPGRNFGFVVLVNINNSQLPMALTYTLCDAVLGLEPVDWCARYNEITATRRAEIAQKREKTLVQPAALPDAAGCAGRYHNPAYGTFEVQNRGGKLSLQLVGLTVPILPSTADEWVLDAKLIGDVYPCRFRRENGAVTGLDVKLEPNLDNYIPFARVD